MAGCCKHGSELPVSLNWGRGWRWGFPDSLMNKELSKQNSAHELIKCVLFKYVYLYISTNFSTFRAGVALLFISETSEQTEYRVCSDISAER